MSHTGFHIQKSKICNSLWTPTVLAAVTISGTASAGEDKSAIHLYLPAKDVCSDGSTSESTLVVLFVFNSPMNISSLLSSWMVRLLGDNQNKFGVALTSLGLLALQVRVKLSPATAIPMALTDTVNTDSGTVYTQ